MSILPGWAMSSNRLPPWYGQGGARGPVSSPVIQTPRPPVVNSVKPPTRQVSVAKSDAGPSSQQPRTATAPNNPWLEPGANQPIYGPKADTSLIDKLMAQIDQNKAAPVNLTSGIERMAPTARNYERSGDMSGLLNELNQWSQTGGFSNADLANIRARGVSPIRSIYANANRNLDRTRAIQGGYAPGFGAAASRMAREMSEQLASKSTDLEGMIAEMVQKGRSDALTRRSDLLNNEEARRNEFINLNAGGKDDASKFNAGSFNDALSLQAKLNADREQQAIDQALQLAKLREEVLGNNQQGRLTERVQSNAGNLDWEKLNQSGATTLIDAMMNQYGPATTFGPRRSA